jgi:hypothetical protein
VRLTILALALLASPAFAQDVVGVQIAASAAAAQALQGPLDGAWTLFDRRGGMLLTLQIGDPPTRGALACAWQDPSGARGFADCSRRTGGLTVRLAGEGVARLIRQGANQWRGTLIRAGHTQSITLRRG